MYDVITTKDKHRDRHYDNDHNEESLKGLNESAKATQKYAVDRICVKIAKVLTSSM